MTDLLVLQHQEDVPAGLLGGFLASRPGLEVRTLRVDLEELPAPDAATRIAVLGSTASAVDGGSEPWVAEEVRFLRRAALNGVPVFGICFGVQVLSAALGGGVHRLETPQVSWVDLETADPQALPGGPWLSWHEDAVTPPPRARVLAQDDVCVQAYSAGPHLGVQFHPEVTPAIVDGWIARHGTTLAASGTDPIALRAQTAHVAGTAARNALRLFARWLRP